MVGAAMAQNPSPMFYKEIQLTHKPYTLHSLSREMQRQSGITFSYNAARINPDQKIRIKEEKITVERLLAMVKKRTGVGYKIVSTNHIVYLEGPKQKGLFVRKKKPEQARVAGAPLPAATPQPARVTGNNQPATTATLSPVDSPATAQIVIVGDSSLAMAYYFSGGGNSGGAYHGAVVRAPGERWSDPYLDLNAPATAKGYSDNKTVAFIKSNLLLSFGVSADEIYYFNPSVRAGFTFLYATLSYNIGSSPQWRYGLGSSARISEKWNMHLAFNTGKKVPGAFNLTTADTIPPLDSIGPPTIITANHAIAVQSRLSRFSLLLEYKFTEDLSLSAGATLNYLTTEYSSNDQPVAFNSFSKSIVADPDKEFRIIKPPYLLGNSYSGNNSGNTKIWIGFQLSLFYRIPFFER